MSGYAVVGLPRSVPRVPAHPLSRCCPGLTCDVTCSPAPGTSAPPGPPSNDSKLEGMISESFVRYMGSYVAWERSELEKIVKDALTSDTLESCETMPVFRSSPELFSQVGRTGSADVLSLWRRLQWVC